MKDKIYIVHNVVDAEHIAQLSQIQPPDLLKENAIVTVGRLCYEKGQDMIPGVAKMLLDAGHEVYWYLVGDGETRDKLISEIERYGVNGNVILLGTKENPFPYMRHCGIYVQPSRTEGWGLTVQECKVIGKTAIVTRIPAFIEQIIDGETGIVADDVSIESIYRAVKFALENPQEVSRIETNLRKNDYDSKAEIECFYHLLEEGCVE